MDTGRVAEGAASAEVRNVGFGDFTRAFAVGCYPAISVAVFYFGFQSDGHPPLLLTIAAFLLAVHGAVVLAENHLSDHKRDSVLEFLTRHDESPAARDLLATAWRELHPRRAPLCLEMRPGSLAAARFNRLIRSGFADVIFLASGFALFSGLWEWLGGTFLAFCIVVVALGGNAQLFSRQ